MKHFLSALLIACSPLNAMQISHDQCLLEDILFNNTTILQYETQLYITTSNGTKTFAGQIEFECKHTRKKGYISNLLVEDSLRNSGYGTLLLHHACSILKDLGCTHAYLCAVPALAKDRRLLGHFYLDRGFKPDADDCKTDFGTMMYKDLVPCAEQIALLYKELPFPYTDSEQ